MNEPLPVLWQIRFSHFNEKARWALDHKRIPHRRRSVVPGAHVLRARRIYGGSTLPALVLDDLAVGGSDRIIDLLEQRWPERPLYPADPDERARALLLQAHFDRELGAQIRSFAFHHLLPDRTLSVATMTRGHSAVVARSFGIAYPVLERVFRSALSADEAGARIGREHTLAALAKVEAELQPSGYLVGSSFSVADLTAAALLSPLTRPPEFPYELPGRWPAALEDFCAQIADRPAFRWAQEMYRRHRGVSAATEGRR